MNMKNKNLLPSSSRRGFIKRAPAAAVASSLIMLDCPSIFSRGDSPGSQENSRDTEVKPRLNCAETILSRANDLYGLDLTPEHMSFASAFGGGMGIGDKCGAVTGSLMILGYLFKPTTGAGNPTRQISGEFLKAFETRMTSLDCRDLKQTYRTESEGCEPVISAALEVLDSTIKGHDSKRTR